MKKQDFAIELAEITGMSIPAALKTTNAMLEILFRKLNEKEKIQFFGFGKFEVQRVPERMGRNIYSGEPFLIPEHHKVFFKPSKHLRDSINGNKLKQ